MSAVYAAADLWRARADYARAFTQADPETRTQLGLNFPRLRVRFDGKPSVTVDYSGVELSYFKTFMLDSDPVHISAMGHYGDKTIARKQWEKFKLYLMQENAVIPDSAVGPYSFRWRSPDDYWRFYNCYVDLRRPAELMPDSVTVPDGVRPIPVDDPFEGAFER